MEAALVYLSAVKYQRLNHSLESWEHHLSFRLYRRFRKMLCQIFARKI